MDNTVSVRKDVKNDVITAEILFKGKYGVSQIRAVVPLKPIREAVNQLAAKSGVSGSSTRPQRAYENFTMKVAGLQLFKTIAQAAKSPLKKVAQSQGERYKKIQKIVAMSESGELDSKYGGWDGLEDAFAKKRKATRNARLAQGMPKQLADRLEQRQAQDDESLLKEAAQEAGVDLDEQSDDDDGDDDDGGDEDEDEDEDEDGQDATAGWNPFKRKRKRQPPRRAIRAKPQEGGEGEGEGEGEGGGGGGGEKDAPKDEEQTKEGE